MIIHNHWYQVPNRVQSSYANFFDPIISTYDFYLKPFVGNNMTRLYGYANKRPFLSDPKNGILLINTKNNEIFDTHWYEKIGEFENPGRLSEYSDITSYLLAQEKIPITITCCQKILYKQY